MASKMKYPCLITSDLHLTDQPITEYRWGLFPWLAEQIKKHHVRSLLILGDVTDSKDRHSAELVNRIVTAINSLPIDNIIIMAGNHDWLKQGQEFFRFLSLLPHVQFITKPHEDIDQHGPLAMFMPYSKNPSKEWAGMDFSHYDLLFMHQTIKGAVASNGQEMDGEELPSFAGPRTYSGDIHVPQVIGGLTYVGSPYHVHFGDKFKPRCILLDRQGKQSDLHFETIQRVVIKVSSFDQLRGMMFRDGDQVKLRVELPESEAHAWSRIRRQYVEWLMAHRVEVHGVELIVVKANKRVTIGGRSPRASFSPQESVLRFVEREELGSEALDAALDILETK
jgi:hypothetical protein